MANRTEPTKEENDADIRALKREARGEPPLKYTQARYGAVVKRSYSSTGLALFSEGFAVRATDDCGQDVEVAFFVFDEFDGGKRRETARMMAEDLADSINEA